MTLRPLHLASLVLVMSVTGCDAEDLSSVKLTLAADGSGTVRVTTLEAPTAAAGAETHSAGIAWKSRARVVTSSGSFASLSALRVADVRFLGSGRFLSINVPLSPERGWAKVLAPADDAERRRVRDALGSPEAKGVATRVKLEVKLPGKIVSAGVHPVLPSVKVTVNKAKGIATLVLPTDLEAKDHSELAWHLTWSAPAPR